MQRHGTGCAASSSISSWSHQPARPASTRQPCAASRSSRVGFSERYNHDAVVCVAVQLSLIPRVHVCSHQHTRTHTMQYFVWGGHDDSARPLALPPRMEPVMTMAVHALRDALAPQLHYNDDPVPACAHAEAEVESCPRCWRRRQRNGGHGSSRFLEMTPVAAQPTGGRLKLTAVTQGWLAVALHLLRAGRLDWCVGLSCVCGCVSCCGYSRPLLTSRLLQHHGGRPHSGR